MARIAHLEQNSRWISASYIPTAYVVMIVKWASQEIKLWRRVSTWGLTSYLRILRSYDDLVWGVTRPRIDPRSTAPELGALSTRGTQPYPSWLFTSCRVFMYKYFKTSQLQYPLSQNHGPRGILEKKCNKVHCNFFRHGFLSENVFFFRYFSCIL